MYLAFIENLGVRLLRSLCRGPIFFTTTKLLPYFIRCDSYIPFSSDKAANKISTRFARHSNLKKIFCTRVVQKLRPFVTNTYLSLVLQCRTSKQELNWNLSFILWCLLFLLFNIPSGDFKPFFYLYRFLWEKKKIIFCTKCP